MLHEFAASLPEALLRVFWWRYHGYLDQEIMAGLSISGQELSTRISDLQAAWYNYCDSRA